MTQTTLNTRSFLLVEVPEDAKEFWISAIRSPDLSLVYTHNNAPMPFINLPLGNWQPIGKADQLTEEEWRGIVDGRDKEASLETGYFSGMFYKNYISGKYHFWLAKESGYSWLASLGLKPEGVFILELK